MEDYVTKKSAIQAVGDIHPLDYNGQGIVNRIKKIPAVDAVEVVRCRECKHLYARSKSLGVYKCAIHNDYPLADYFCADGERKDGGQNELL